MKKLTATFLVTLSLSGCMYQVVNQYDIQRAITICGALDKVVEINAYPSGVETVLCNKGSTINLNRADEVKK